MTEINNQIIISTLGSKGGTGKSTILIAMIYIFSKFSKKILIINTDESSQSLPLRLYELKIDDKTCLINVEISSLVNFINFNKGLRYLSYFDYIFFDLKGSDMEKENFKNLLKIVDFFILPVIPSKDGIPAFLGNLTQLKECISENKTMSFDIATIFKNAINNSKKNIGSHALISEIICQFEEAEKKFKETKVIALQNNYGYTTKYLNESDTVNIIENIVNDFNIQYFYNIEGVLNLESKSRPIISISKRNRNVISEIISIINGKEYSVEAEEGDEL